MNKHQKKIERIKRVKRRIVDYLFKYASENDTLEIARKLKVKTD